MKKITVTSKELHNIFQPILEVDHQMNSKINTYEMLMRNQSGSFPGQDFLESLNTENGNEIWTEVSKRSIDDVLHSNPERKIYINLEPCQLKFDIVWQFLADIRKQYKEQIAIELTERREGIHGLDYLDNEIQRLKQIGFELAIDDVCAGSNSYAFVVRQLNAISRIKLSLLLFRKEDAQVAINFVKSWLSFANEHHLDFVLEGISDKRVAEKFAGEPALLQQGYYWGKGAKTIS